jgi:hypothetical protein
MRDDTGKVRYAPVISFASKEVRDRFSQGVIVIRDNFFEYIPQFKLIVIGNHMPELHNVDDAARRRFNTAPFINKSPTVDPKLEEKLRAEWPGILRWMIDGCPDWQANGLIRPSVMTASTAEYFGDQDLLAQWLDDCCERKRQGRPTNQEHAPQSDRLLGELREGPWRRSGQQQELLDGTAGARSQPHQG